MGRVLVLILVGAGIVFGIAERDGLGMTYGPACAVGVTGTAAVVHAQGWFSSRACDVLSDTTTVATYRFSGSINVPVVCQYDIAGIRYTVHDEGVLKLIGSGVCTSLAESAQRVVAEAAVRVQAATTTAPETSAPRTPAPTVVHTLAPLPVVTAAPVTLSTPTVPRLGCLVGISGHDMELTVIGPDPLTICRHFTSVLIPPDRASWFVPTMVAGTVPSARNVVCDRTFGNLLTFVTDTGGRYFGASICWQLEMLEADTLTMPETCGLAVQGHNATIAVIGAGAERQCSHLESTFKVSSVRGWDRVDDFVRTGPGSTRTICSVGAAQVVAQVWDTGGAIYGEDICAVLSAADFAD